MNDGRHQTGSIKWGRLVHGAVLVFAGALVAIVFRRKVGRSHNPAMIAWCGLSLLLGYGMVVAGLALYMLISFVTDGTVSRMSMVTSLLVIGTVLWLRRHGRANRHYGGAR